MISDVLTTERLSVLLEWTHDPTRQGADSVWVDGTWCQTWSDGWETVVVEGLDDPRCDAIFPSSDSGTQGGFCAAPNHEPPHVWAAHGYVLRSISRKRRMVVA